MSVVSVCMGNAQWVMLCYVDYSFYDLMAYCTSADVDANADEEREREHERALALTASWVPFRCGPSVGDNLRDLIYA